MSTVLILRQLNISPYACPFVHLLTSSLTRKDPSILLFLIFQQAIVLFFEIKVIYLKLCAVLSNFLSSLATPTILKCELVFDTIALTLK